ncbi:unannotated protein [freshwater metagenome]|uniref:Unannotated protein n=1 Tax=freshwater metagenome TaxID=449393 RepID=A0A6J7F325_9ZZZZ
MFGEMTTGTGRPTGGVRDASARCRRTQSSFTFTVGSPGLPMAPPRNNSNHTIDPDQFASLPANGYSVRLSKSKCWVDQPAGSTNGITPHWPSDVWNRMAILRVTSP